MWLFKNPETCQKYPLKERDSNHIYICTFIMLEYDTMYRGGVLAMLEILVHVQPPLIATNK